MTQKPISETRYESRQYTTYHPRYTTDYHDSVRTYQVPVTEQQWVLGYQRTLNIFAPPVLSYRLVPVTRWETRSRDGPHAGDQARLRARSSASNKCPSLRNGWCRTRTRA